MDWLLSLNTIIAMELIARRKWYGWAVGLGNQALWFCLIVYQQQLYGLAVNRRFKQGDELKEEVCFIDVVTFGKQAENAAKYLSKGSKVNVEGRLQKRRWETEAGEKRSKHEVVAESVLYLDGTKGHGEAQEDPGITAQWERADV